MKKILIIFLLLLNILPTFAYVRDDTDSGLGAVGAIIFFAVFIIGVIAELKKSDKK